MSTPDFLSKDVDGRTSVCIDACIVEAVKFLWNHKVRTLGSCCGHGKEDPSLILHQSEHPDRVRGLLEHCDSRTWKLLQWRLSEV